MTPMGGKAFPGGVDGRILRGLGGAFVTIEPTNPGDRVVELWAQAGVELPGVRLIAPEVRRMIADLAVRLAVIDPARQHPVDVALVSGDARITLTPAPAAAPAGAEPAAAGPSPLPGPSLPPSPASLAVEDMRAAAADLTARRLGDPLAARIRRWADAIESDMQWAADVIAAADKVSATVHQHRTPTQVGPVVSAALVDLDAALAAPTPAQLLAMPDDPNPRDVDDSPVRGDLPSPEAP